jgi:hypothetical protein
MPMPIEEVSAAPYVSSPIAVPIEPISPTTSSRPAAAAPAAPRPVTPAPVGGDSGFQAPPRPTEELERSKIIDLSKLSEPTAPDPTDALFQAIQAVREKNTQKVTTTAQASAARDNWGQSRPSRIPPQVLFIGTLAVIFGIAIYVFTSFVSRKPETTAEAPKKPAAPVVENRPAAIAPGAAGAKLLGEGEAPSRMPVRPAPATRSFPPVRGGGNAGGRAMDRDEDRGGGARYRDDRDPPIETVPEDTSEGVTPDADIPESAPPPPAAAPADPSQIAPDRIIPEAGTLPNPAQGEPPAE